MPMGPDEYPDYPAPRPDPAATCTATPTPSRSATGSASRPRSSTPSGKPAGGWSIRLGRRVDGGIRLPRRRQRPSLGPALPRLPGQLRRRDDPRPPLHRPRRSARSRTASACWWSGSATARVDITSELSRKGVAEKVFISTRSGAWVMPKYCPGQPDRHSGQDQPPPAARSSSAGWRGSCRDWPPGGWRTSASPTPTTTSWRRTRPSRASCCCGWARATPSPSRTSSELQGDSVRFEDGSVEQIDAIIYATGYKITFPFFDPELPLGSGQPAAALQADLLAGHRRPGLRRVRPGDPDPLPLRRAAVEAGRALRRRRLRPPLDRGDGGDDPPRRGDPHRDLHRSAPAHDADRVVHRTSTTSGRREIPAGRERAARGMAPKLAGRVVTAEAAAADARVRRGEAEEQPV